ncbi:MAG: hypothetical protein CBB97_07935 [Candidatus Endolissoclinum sp. TMED37]|nr:MAG: hypothetical protein CBB97_07935 [Candidatus Endolissoclinum sp. TMED37]
MFESFRPSLVIHLASLKSVNESLFYPLRYYENDVVGAINLLETMGKFNCKNINFSSSASAMVMLIKKIQLMKILIPNHYVFIVKQNY